MGLSSAQKTVLDIITIIGWALEVLVIIFILSKRNKLKEETGLSFKTYLALVGVTEIFYVIGAIMVLSAMGINIMRHLSKLEFWKFSQVISRFDMSTINVIGAIGWFGFVINRFISFLSPGYLLINGGKRLPKYVYLSSWIEIGLEILITILIALSLIAG